MLYHSQTCTCEFLVSIMGGICGANINDDLPANERDSFQPGADQSNFEPGQISQHKVDEPEVKVSHDIISDDVQQNDKDNVARYSGNIPRLQSDASILSQQMEGDPANENENINMHNEAEFSNVDQPGLPSLRKTQSGDENLISPMISSEILTMGASRSVSQATLLDSANDDSEINSKDYFINGFLEAKIIDCMSNGATTNGKMPESLLDIKHINTPFDVDSQFTTETINICDNDANIHGILYLFQWQNEDTNQLCMTFGIKRTIESKLQIHLKLDFDGSSHDSTEIMMHVANKNNNYKVDNEKLIFEGKIEPFFMEFLCTVCTTDSFSYQMSYQITQPSEEWINKMLTIYNEMLTNCAQKYQHIVVTNKTMNQILYILDNNNNNYMSQAIGNHICNYVINENQTISETPNGHKSELIADILMQVSNDESIPFDIGYFIDVQFAPISQSLRNNIYDKETEHISNYTWRRAGDIYNITTDNQLQKQLKLFDGISPEDINQGGLGDCWLCSSIACIAERPQLIQRLFITKNINSFGIYQIQLCRDGIWQSFVIDDFLPCDITQNKPIFIHSSHHQDNSNGSEKDIDNKNISHEIWVCMVEKAYAKSFGAYDQLISGLCRDALVDLTGFPVQSFRFNQDPNNIHHTGNSDENETKSRDEDLDSKELWTNLLTWSVDDLVLMTASCNSNSDDPNISEIFASYGMTSGHAYSLMDAKEKLGYKLIRLRNPWGSGTEWKGKWCDESELWTEQAQKEFEYEPNLQRSDGTFWMELTDFMQFFTSIDICFARTDWVSCRVQSNIEYDGKTLKNYPCFDLEIKDGICEYIGIHQQDTRSLHINFEQNLSIVGIIVDCATNDVIEERINASVDRDNFDKIDLEPGNYKIYLFTPGTTFRNNNVNENIDKQTLDWIRNISVSVHVHSCQQELDDIKLDDIISLTEQTTSHHEMRECLSEYIEKYGQVNQMHELLDCYKLSFGTCYISAFLNKSENMTFQVCLKIDKENMNHAVGFEPEKMNENDEIVFLLPNDQLTLAYVLAPVERRATFGYSYSMSFQSIQ